MDTNGVINGLTEKNKELSDLNDEMKDLAIEAAKKEADYRMARADETLRLKNEGMSVTLISDLVKGKTAEEKQEWQIAKAHYNACREKMYSVREAISSYQSILSAMKTEYLGGNYQDNIPEPNRG